MPRWAKWLLVGVATTLALLGGAAWLGLRALDPDRLAATVVAQTKAATGRDLVIGGKVSIRVFPAPAVIAEDIRLRNADWGSRPDMMRVRHAEGDVAFWPLILGRVRVHRIVLTAADALLETDVAGTGNWVFRHADEPGLAAGAVPEIALDGLHIEDAQIAYRDGKSGQETHVAIQRLTLDGRDSERIDLAASFRGQSFSAKGTVGHLESLFESAIALPVDLALATDGTKAVVKGTLGTGKEAGQLDVAVEAEVTDAAGLSRLVGTDLPVPMPLKLSAKARHNGTEDIVDPFRLALGSHVLSGRATLRTGSGRPSLDASVAASSLDLSQFAQPKVKHPASPERYLFSDAPLPLRELPALDVRADVRVEKMVLPNRVVLEAVHAGLVVKNAHLELQPVMFRVAGGAVSGHATLDTPQGKTPRLAVKFEGKSISLEELGAEVGRAKQISGGRTDLAIDLSGSGHSLHDLLAGASGEIRIAVGPAILSDELRDAGGDAWAKLFDTLSSFHQAEKGTKLACAVARLPVRKGLITIKRSMAYETTEVNVVIAGTINLSDESLALVLRPAFKQGLELGTGNLAKLVHVEGTLTNPSIGLDVLGVWRQLLSLYAAFATSGASLLVEEVMKRPVDSHPCQSALTAGASKAVQQ